jgi:hypothetical protein
MEKKEETGVKREREGEKRRPREEEGTHFLHLQNSRYPTFGFGF